MPRETKSIPPDLFNFNLALDEWSQKFLKLASTALTEAEQPLPDWHEFRV